MVRQSLREPTMAAAAMLGFSYLLAQDAAYTGQAAVAATATTAGAGVGGDSSSPQRSPAVPRPFLEYVLSGNGLCLDLLQRRQAASTATAAS